MHIRNLKQALNHGLILKKVDDDQHNSTYCQWDES